jgi:putative FmdB family regulatory protein
MPTYDYECKDCQHQVLDVFQKFDEDPLTECPKCNKEALFRIVTGGIHASVKGVNTIGSLADHNSRVHKNQIEENAHAQREANPEPPKPWYHKHGNATSKEINKMNKQQQIRYIMEGRK